MELKRKYQRKAISLEMKIDILDCLAKGHGPTKVGKSFQLGESTIRTIKKNEVAIRKSFGSGTHMSAKLTSYTRDANLERTERALIIWIKQFETQKQTPISGTLIQQKARQFYEKMKKPVASSCNGNKTFSASKGWLTSFLKRNAVRNNESSKNTATNKPSTISSDATNLEQEIDEEDFDTFSNDEDESMIMDNVTNHDDVDDLTSDVAKDIESEIKVEKEEVQRCLTLELIAEGLQLCNNLENHFINNDSNDERALKFQHNLRNSMSVYYEMYMELKKEAMQS